MQPAPHRAIPAPRATVAIWSLSPSPYAPPKITADRSPRSAASSTCPASAASGTPSSTRSTGPGSVGQGRVAGHPADLVVLGVHQVRRRSGRAARDLGDHPLAEGARPRAGAHQGHAARLEHRAQRGRVTSSVMNAAGACGGWPSCRRSPPSPPACRGCRTRRRPRAWPSWRSTARAPACGSRRSRGPDACGTAAPGTARRGRCCRRSGRSRAPSGRGRRCRGTGSSS